jgi:hypothetical protein
VNCSLRILISSVSSSRATLITSTMMHKMLSITRKSVESARLTASFRNAVVAALLFLFCKKNGVYYESTSFGIELDYYI